MQTVSSLIQKDARTVQEHIPAQPLSMWPRIAAKPPPTRPHHPLTQQQQPQSPRTQPSLHLPVYPRNPKS